MDSSVSPKDENWFLRLCHHISNAVYNTPNEKFSNVSSDALNNAESCTNRKREVTHYSDKEAL